MKIKLFFLFLLSLIFSYSAFATDGKYQKALHELEDFAIGKAKFKKCMDYDYEKETPRLGFSRGFCGSNKCKITFYIYNSNQLVLSKNKKGEETVKSSSQNNHPITDDLIPYEALNSFFFKVNKMGMTKTPNNLEMAMITDITGKQGVAVSNYQGNYLKVRTTCPKQENVETITLSGMTILEQFLNVYFSDPTR